MTRESPHTLASRKRPRLLERIDRRPAVRERWRVRLRRSLLTAGIVIGLLLVLSAVLLVRAYLESRWTLPETQITARIEEDLQYNITFDPDAGNRIRNVNYTTNELIHLGNPLGGLEGVLARVERNRTENRETYELKNARDLKVASITHVEVSKRPLVSRTEVVSGIETGMLLGAGDGIRQPVYATYSVDGRRVHHRTATTVLAGRRGGAWTVAETAEFWGWFGRRARSGSSLVEYALDLPSGLLGRLEREHREWHGSQQMEVRDRFGATLDELARHARPLFRSDEGWPGPWWQLDLLPQGGRLHLAASLDGERQHTISVAWDKTGLFPWRWLNGGYRARDAVGELFRVQIRDFWFHFQNELAYLYFLDLDGNGHIDRDTELIGQVYYKTADSPLRERFRRNPDVPLTQENTQEFTRNKTYVFRVGADPAMAARDFELCDGIEKLLPDAIVKGFGRDSHLGYIERARDDFLLAREPTAARLHNVTSPQDAIDWKRGVVALLRAARRDYAEELAAYYAETPGFPGLAATTVRSAPTAPPTQPPPPVVPQPSQPDTASPPDTSSVDLPETLDRSPTPPPSP
ncbi:MAG: hypothetical protein PVF43_07860 [Candidatus Eiseniibacteriota bacterium]